MIQKLIAFALIIVMMGGLFVRCTESISDCPSKMCILANENGWRLTEVYQDAEKQTGDFSNYRITLSLPEPSATQGNFVRSTFSGKQDTGIWRIENLDDVLLLTPDSSPEEPYVIQTFTPRTLVLVINRDSQKVGPTQVKYVFEPI